MGKEFGNIKNRIQQGFNKFNQSNGLLVSFLKFNLAIAMLIFLIIAVNAGDIIVKNGELNITDNLFVDINTLFVDSMNNRVGIGTTSPQGLLHIENSSAISVPWLNISDETFPLFVVESGNAIIIKSTTGGSTGISNIKSNGALFLEGSSSTSWGLAIGLDNAIEVPIIQGADRGQTSPRNLVLQPYGGSVGIGTTSPTDLLNVYDGNVNFSTSSIDGLYYNNLTGQLYLGGLQLDASNSLFILNNTGSRTAVTIYQSKAGEYGLIVDTISTGTSTNILDLRSAGTQRVIFRSDGKVGIGDTTPDRDLDIGLSSINSGDSAWTVESASIFKDNIINLAIDQDILNKWSNIKIYNWTYKESFLIEELGLNESTEQTRGLSQVIHTGLMADEFNPLFIGNNDTKLDYSYVQLKIIEAIQQLIIENNALKARIAALEAK